MTWLLVGLALMWIALTWYLVLLAYDVWVLWRRDRGRRQRRAAQARRDEEGWHRAQAIRGRLEADQRRRLAAAAQLGRPPLVHRSAWFLDDPS